MSLPRVLVRACALTVLLVSCDPATVDRPSDGAGRPSTPASVISTEPPSVVSPEPSPTAEASPPSGETYLVWAPGGMGASALDATQKLRGVRRAPVITGGLVWMSDATAGKLPSEGYSIPLEVAFAQPDAFAGVVPGGNTIPVLDEGDAVIAQTAHALRGEPQVPFTLRTDRGFFRVIGLVADETTAGFELFASGPAPEDWGADYTVVAGDVTVRELRSAVAPHVDGPFRVRQASDTPFRRHADAVHPPMLLKDRFGEFGARPLPDGRLDVDPVWLKRNIVERQVPILGRLTCHRVFLEQVEAALASARVNGLSESIDPGGYAGCYSGRFILSDPSGRLSSHAWGAAFDINAPGNAYGTEPTMDRELVHHMEQWGFFWGGRWMIPDGMHFEWARVLD